jgi:hypothetical protein
MPLYILALYLTSSRPDVHKKHPGTIAMHGIIRDTAGLGRLKWAVYGTASFANNSGQARAI